MMHHTLTSRALADGAHSNQHLGGGGGLGLAGGGLGGLGGAFGAGFAVLPIADTVTCRHGSGTHMTRPCAESKSSVILCATRKMWQAQL